MKRRMLVAAAFATAVGLPSLAAAQTIGTATVQVETKQPFGKYLADVTGRALYMFTADKKGVSNCHDKCAEMWPPMITIGPPAPGDDAKASMLGTIKRPDGRLQVTYNGLPLYYYAKDQSTGATTGQDVKDSGGEWYLVAPKGTKIEVAAAKTDNMQSGAQTAKGTAQASRNQSMTSAGQQQDVQLTAMSKDKLRESLQQAGFQDVQIVDAAYLIHARTKDGDAVVMMINPPSMTTSAIPGSEATGAASSSGSTPKGTSGSEKKQ